jgi:hypothetical protein
MELDRRTDGRFENGRGNVVELEDEYVYPMLKTSDLAAGRIAPSRWMLVPQRAIGADTSTIAASAPKTWAYLTNHADALNRRGSRIYRDRPPFSTRRA